MRIVGNLVTISGLAPAVQNPPEDIILTVLAETATSVKIRLTRSANPPLATNAVIAFSFGGPFETTDDVDATAPEFLRDVAFVEEFVDVEFTFAPAGTDREWFAGAYAYRNA